MKVKKILWKYRPHKDGRCDVKIYVYHQGRQKHFSTGLSVLPDEWDEKEGMVKKRIRTPALKMPRSGGSTWSWRITSCRALPLIPTD